RDGGRRRLCRRHPRCVLCGGGQGLMASRGMFHHSGPRTRRLVAFLKRRAKNTPGLRPTMDCKSFPALFGKRAVVFTDTADFTVRTARDGILHFLMLFERLVREAEPLIQRAGGEIVKVEGDSLLLRHPDVASACRGVLAIDELLRRTNTKRA